MNFKANLLVSALILLGVKGSVGSFSWRDCNPSNPDHVTYMSATPDPILIPGVEYMNISTLGTVPIVSPTAWDVSYSYRANASEPWEDFPDCYNQSVPIGNCHVDDICAVFDLWFPSSQPCPPAFINSGVPCRCPFDKLTGYDLVGLEIDFPYPMNLFKEGDYKLHSVLSNSEQELFCAEGEFTFKSAV